MEASPSLAQASPLLRFKTCTIIPSPFKQARLQLHAEGRQVLYATQELSGKERHAKENKRKKLMHEPITQLPLPLCSSTFLETYRIIFRISFSTVFVRESLYDASFSIPHVGYRNSW